MRHLNHNSHDAPLKHLLNKVFWGFQMKFQFLTKIFQYSNVCRSCKTNINLLCGGKYCPILTGTFELFYSDTYVNSDTVGSFRNKTKVSCYTTDFLISVSTELNGGDFQRYKGQLHTQLPLEISGTWASTSHLCLWKTSPPMSFSEPPFQPISMF